MCGYSCQNRMLLPGAGGSTFRFSTTCAAGANHFAGIVEVLEGMILNEFPEILEDDRLLAAL